MGVFFGFYFSSRGVIRKRRLAFGILFWLHQGGIPHCMCRFYCSLRGHQRTKEMDSAEPLSSMEPRLRGSVDSTSSPRGIRCGGALWLPRYIPIQVAVFRCKSLLASSEFYLAICVRAGIVRVSVGVFGLWSHVFHYWGDGLFVPAATLGFAMVYSWICADRDWVVSFGG